jgi:hypothetical protein
MADAIAVATDRRVASVRRPTRSFDQRWPGRLGQFATAPDSRRNISERALEESLFAFVH